MAYIRPDRLFPAITKIYLPPALFAVLCVILGISYYAYSLAFLQTNYLTTAYDFGFMDHWTWGLGQFHLFSRIEGLPPKLVPTFSPILGIPGLLFRVWDDSGVLILFEAVGLGMGFFPLFMLAHDLLASYVSATLLALAYILASLALATMGVPLLVTSWLPTSYLLAFYLAYRKKWLGYGFSVTLALLCKESAGIHIVALGILVTYALKEKRIGFFTAFAGLFVFVLLNFYFLPRISEGFIVNKDVSLQQKITAVATVLHYKESITYFLSEEGSFKFILFLATAGFLIVLNPLSWIVIPLSLLDPGAIDLVKVYDFYSYPPALSFLFICLVLTINRIPKQFLNSIPKAYFALYVVLAVILIYSKPRAARSPLLLFNNEVYMDRGRLDSQREEVLSAIRNGSSVITQDALVPHLTHRERIGILGRRSLEDYEYVLLGQDYRVSTAPLTLEELHERVERLKNDKIFEVVKSTDAFILFKRKELTF